MLTRREFLGAGVGAAVAAHAFALPGDKMRYAMSGHQFRGLKPHPEVGIKMTAQYGYHGLEPFQDDMPQYLKQPPEVFKKLLDDAGIALCTVGSGGQYLDAARLPDTIESNAARAKYISHFGCKHLKVNLSQRVGQENLSAANGKILARNLNEVGKRTMDAGIKFAFHPHAWTLVERQPELDMVMELTDPKYVYLVLDTGHATLGGIDPVKALRDYYPRVASIHLKDAEAKYSTARRVARAGAERRRAQASQPVQAVGQRRRRFRCLLPGAASARLRRVGDDGLRHAAARRRYRRRRHEPAQDISH